MAAYFNGAPEIQADGLQTLYLMNPAYVTAYSDHSASAAPAAHQTNMVFLNSPLNSLNAIPHHQQQQQQHFVGIPLQPPNEPNRPQPMQAAAAHYNLWAPALPSSTISTAGHGRRQGLSLSLSPHQQQHAPPFGPYRAELQQQQESMAAAAAASSGEEVKANGVAGLQSMLMGSKYLKAAQQLLDEVVSVGKGRGGTATAAKGNEPSSKSTMKAGGGGKDLEGDQGSDGGGGGKTAAGLSTADRQELQTKKAKLINMLDEVEQRYRQYHHQMQVVVSSFEAVAGFGSARTYTALALQTISKQFRWLRDAISGQIRATSRSLGEEDGFAAGGSKSSVGSRLRFVDHHLRQQRALQQLGMIQHNAWRPQRGLPERAVSLLRAWLFEHFLHPYPKDSDKHMLAKQTGLTRSQVSNWFINARVRLWKPMVEEMYLEETKEHEPSNGNNVGDVTKASKSEDSEHSASKSTSQQANISTTPSRTENDPKPPPQRQTPADSSDLAMYDNHCDDESAIIRQRLKKARSDDSLPLHQMGMAMKQDELSNRELLMQFMDQGAGFGAYGPIGEIGRFGHHEQFAPRFGGNAVSLTLGLPHCEALSLSGSQQPPYLPNESMQLGRRLELGSEENNYFRLNSSSSSSNGNNPSAPHPPIAYESIDIQSRKRFAAQLLPDFVA